MQDLRERGPDADAAAGSSPAPRLWRVVAIAVSLAALLVGVGGVLIWRAVQHGRPACQDATFGSSRGPVRQSPLSGVAGTDARLRAAFGRARGEVAYCNDFADPFVLRVGSRYYAYSTQSGSMNVPAMRVAGLFDSGRRHDALPHLPSWSRPGAVWAPSVLATGQGYVLYYTTAVSATGAQCLSHAIGPSPDGPFVDMSPAPWICPNGGGAIDASPFTAADGRQFLVWKSDTHGFSGIAAAQLSADGLQLTSPIAHLLTVTEPWEGNTIEGPALAPAGTGDWLFYSGGDWRTAGYAIGVAHCAGPLGPCEKTLPTALVTSTPGAAGPGGEQLFADGDGHEWMVLHAWVNARVGYPAGARGLFVVPISLAGPMPVVGVFDPSPA